jgi:adenosylcobinamide kinase/adenosylcobinamide-phosphate guanylyltransferase
VTEAVPTGRVLVLGGARSGKSTFAEGLLSHRSDVVYVAPWSDPDDPEWLARVAAHRASRPSSWTTIESADVASVLASGSGCHLVDCVTTWLARAMEEVGCWRSEPAAEKELAVRIDALVSAYSGTSETVLVSNEVGQGVVPATASGRLFRDEVGRVNQRLAAVSDQVWFITAGIPSRLA